MPESEVTLGELHRLLIALGETVAEVRVDVKRINGSVARHSASIAEQQVRLDGHDREIRDVKHAQRTGHEGNRPDRPPMPVLPPEVVELLAQLKAASGENAPALTRKEAKWLWSTMVAVWTVGIGIVGALAWIATHVRVVW